MVYYEPQTPEEKPPGCLDALVLTRAVFGVLMWPLLAIVAVVVDVGIILYLFNIQPALALIPVAITAGAIALFARWDQRRFRPPDA